MATLATPVTPASTFIVIEPESSTLGCSRDPPSLSAGAPAQLWRPGHAARFLKRLLPAHRSIPPRSGGGSRSSESDNGVLPARRLAADAVESPEAHLVEMESHTLDNVSLASALAVIVMLTGVTFVGSMSTGILTIGLPSITEDLSLPQSLLLWCVGFPS